MLEMCENKHNKNKKNKFEMRKKKKKIVLVTLTHKKIQIRQLLGIFECMHAKKENLSLFLVTFKD